MNTILSLIFAAVAIGTWNGKWFPSGRAEHRAPQEQEEATIRASGKMLRRALDAVDPAGTNDVVLCINEIANRKAAEKLAAAIGRTNLVVAAISDYRKRGKRRDYQQDAILSTLPVLDAGWTRWKASGGVGAPRGCVFADLAFSKTKTVRVFAVHLKSNYGQKDEETRRANIAKRTLAARQLAAWAEGSANPVVICGDFNADFGKKEFEDDTLFKVLEHAGFANPLAKLPAALRITHPGRGRFPGSTLDYIMLRALRPSSRPAITNSGGISDHDAVTILVE